MSLTVPHRMKAIWLQPAVALLAVATAGAQPSTVTPAEFGTLVVHVEPAATIYIDGTVAGSSATDHRAEVSAALHRVHVVHPDYQELVRTVRVTTGATTTLTLALADQAIRKAPAGRSRGGATRGSSSQGVRGATRSTAPALDPDLATGIEYVKEGDFEPAVDVLFAVTRNLAGVPRMIAQLAQAYLYLGAALVEREQTDLGKRAFAFARRIDKTLTPRATEFSRQILAAWDDSRAITIGNDDEFELVRAAAPTAGGETSPDLPPPATGEPAEFVTETESSVTLDVAVATAGHPCSGTIGIDRDAHTLQWTPKAAGCRSPFTVRFEDVRSPLAGPRGGILLQFRTEEPAITVMPSPDADLLEPDVDKMLVSELPLSTRVHMRRAERSITRALGRPYDPRLYGLLVYVALPELLEHATDFDGGMIRTSGKLASPPALKGQYALVDDNAMLPIVPIGAAVQLLRSQARAWLDKELIVSGTFKRPAIAANAAKGVAPPTFMMAITKVEPAEGLKYKGPARATTLEDVVKNPPGPKDLVRVIGKYRGLDSFGDLPLTSRRSSGDWVIKDQDFAVWVTGKPPAGPGFSLTTSSQVDLHSAWVAVTGTIEEKKNFLYLRADKVEMSPPPSEAATISSGQVLTGARLLRPDIVYTDPVEPTEQIARDGQILLQFSKMMNDASFASHVLLRYTDGAPLPATDLDVAYYPDRNRSVIIDPGVVLQAGKTLECVLLPGVMDVDGRALTGTDEPGGRVLRWNVQP